MVNISKLSGVTRKVIDEAEEVMKRLATFVTDKGESEKNLVNLTCAVIIASALQQVANAADASTISKSIDDLSIRMS